MDEKGGKQLLQGRRGLRRCQVWKNIIINNSLNQTIQVEWSGVFGQNWI